MVLPLFFCLKVVSEQYAPNVTVQRAAVQRIVLFVGTLSLHEKQQHMLSS